MTYGQERLRASPLTPIMEAIDRYNTNRENNINEFMNKSFYENASGVVDTRSGERSEDEQLYISGENTTTDSTTSQ